MSVHNVAAAGFQQAAQVYEEARPSYPTEVIEYVRSLCSSTPNVIVDLGAGTGKLTRLLAPLNAREIIAIEPVVAMRENLQTIPIITRVLDGSAEQMPLDDNSVDLVLCAQAFHWFANHRALAEINRVLKPNGLFVLIWNQPDTNKCSWYSEIRYSIESVRSSDTPQYISMEWRKAFDNQQYFTSLEEKQFCNCQRANRDIIIKRIQSTSFVSVLPDDERKKLLDGIRHKLDTLDIIRDQEEFDVFHLTDVYYCSALKSSS